MEKGERMSQKEKVGKEERGKESPCQLMERRGESELGKRRRERKREEPLFGKKGEGMRKWERKREGRSHRASFWKKGGESELGNRRREGRGKEPPCQ